MAAAADVIEIRPQPGPQERFLATVADIAIYGGAAGGGKTWALLLEPLRHIDNKEFGAVVFRRESVQITNEGGLWDEAMKLYPLLGGRARLQPRPTHTFPRGGRISFAHLNLETDVEDWQGAQIPLIEFDELTHFTKHQFFYMLSRNRSTCGVRPYVRATCNPDVDSWVAEFIAWWIDQDSGLPLPERSGVVRWFVRIDDTIYWGDSPDELAAVHGVPAADAKSVTFIAANLADNRILLAKDPGYLANLKALSRVERERLLGGNWKIRPAAGLYFLRQDVTMLDSRPEDAPYLVRAWDLAATAPSEDNPDPDWTVGILMGRRPSGRILVADVLRVRRRASEVRELVKRTANQDGMRVAIRLPQDPGQAGKDQVASYVGELFGWPVFTRLVTGDKVLRAEPFAAQWQAGNVEVVRAPWNEAFFGELEGFPEAKHDDQVDACSEGFAALPLSGARPDYSRGGLRRHAEGAL
jgi:predicted phage terminase large subunit-like protein